MSYAQFELSSPDADNNVNLARKVFERANLALRQANQKDERVLLLEAWLQFETLHGDDKSLDKVKDKMPRKIKKRQRVQTHDGVCLIFKVLSLRTIICTCDQQLTIILIISSLIKHNC